MPTLEFETLIAAPLEKVWNFFQGVVNGIPAIYPREDQTEVEQADLPLRVGSKVVVRSRGPVGRIRLVAKVIEHQPPHAVVFGEEARFVDVQESGPFKSWRHEHELERIDEKTTRMLDRVTYRVPYGLLGWIADAIVVRRKVHAMFRYRSAAVKKILE
jgi:ligand-binding SRPBCC domain-containing protein